MLNHQRLWTKKTLVGLGLGQFLSLLITSTGFSSSELARRRINAPTSESFLNYVFLAIVYGRIMLYLRKALKAKWYYYILLGLVDVEVNFLGGSNPRIGDSLPIAGSTLYAMSNVSEEFLVKNADRVELMSFLGIFGAIVSAIQISILERGELKSIHQSAGAALPIFGFSLAMFLFYSFVPVLLKINGSTMLNLSLLTSDMWAVLIHIFAYHGKVDWMYFVAFAAVVLGLVIYSLYFGFFTTSAMVKRKRIAKLELLVKNLREANNLMWRLVLEAIINYLHPRVSKVEHNTNRSSKVGDNSKNGLASTSIGDMQDNLDKNKGRDGRQKK